MAAILATSLISAASGLISGLMDKMSDSEKGQAELVLKQMEAEQELMKGQLDVNKTEAGSASVYVAGWRPAVGWICAGALAYEYIVRPLGIWGMAVWAPGGPILPSISGDGMLWELMFGMLGMAGLRTFEKAKKVTK